MYTAYTVYIRLKFVQLALTNIFILHFTENKKMMMKLKELQKAQKQRSKADDPIPDSILHPNYSKPNESGARSLLCSPPQLSLMSDITNESINITDAGQSKNTKNKPKKVYFMEARLNDLHSLNKVAS